MAGKKLSNEAFGGIAGKDYVPYVDGRSKKGFNIAVLIIGVVLAAIFAASTAYSGMKAGLTVAAGIPGAIIGSALVSIFAKSKGILGKNLIQGMSSGGESVASGIIFVLPAVILAGGKISFLEASLVGIVGTLFGVGVTNLVYNYLIVEEHGKLIYPESMAISETLVAYEAGGDSIKHMGIGAAIGGVLTIVSSSFLNLCNNVISISKNTVYKFKFMLEVNPMLLGIGFIVGLDVSLTMFASSMLANFAFVPLIGYFTDMAKADVGVWSNAGQLVNSLTASEITSNYVKYIGAGMMICGGIVGVIKLIPTIISSLKATLGAKAGGTTSGGIARISLFVGAIGAIATSFIITGKVNMAIVGVLLSLVLAALFVIVSGRLTGTIGTSNLPVSGMTIASLVIAALIFVLCGWTDKAANITLLLFTTFIVVAISMAGGYTQSHKVSFIIGGNKKEMDKAFIIAGVVGVLAVVGTIVLLANQLAITENPPFALPQANLMSTLTTGIMSGEIPWVMIIVGIALGFVAHLLKLPVMTVAIGFYLPISTTSIILLGALIRVLVEKVFKDEEVRKQKVGNGISLSSGLVAGGSILGLIGIIFQVTGIIKVTDLTGFAAGNGIAVILLVLLLASVTISIMKSKVHK